MVLLASWKLQKNFYFKSTSDHGTSGQLTNADHSTSGYLNFENTFKIAIKIAYFWP